MNISGWIAIAEGVVYLAVITAAVISIRNAWIGPS